MIYARMFITHTTTFGVVGQTEDRLPLVNIFGDCLIFETEVISVCICNDF